MRSRKIPWWLMLFVSATISVSAQGGGIKGLIGLSSLSFEDAAFVTDEEARIALQGGGFYTIPVISGGTFSFSVQPEVYYASENSTVNLLLQATGTSEKFNTNTQSVYVPVLLRLGIFDPAAIQLGVFAGPHLRYAFQSTTTPDTPGASAYVPTFPDANTVQWGLTLGMDIVFTRALVVDLRYNYGLSPAYDAANEEQQGSAKATALLVGIGFFM